MSDREISHLLDRLDRAFERKAWHGPNLRGSLRGVTASQAAWRPAPGRHNVWELALHCAYWKYAVWRQLTGERRGSFPFAGSNFFPRPEGPASETDWKRDLRLLATVHRRLRAAVAGIPPRLLGAKPAGSKYDRRTLVSGVVDHDLYHAGQIQLLKRLRAGA
ncbi:MAG: DinB family protein [Thermoanaerobaculia bacterium]